MTSLVGARVGNGVRGVPLASASFPQGHRAGQEVWHEAVELIAKHLKGRLGKQCRELWHNHLNPEVKKSCWTEEEDRIICEAHKVLGNRWAEIARCCRGGEPPAGGRSGHPWRFVGMFKA